VTTSALEPSFVGHDQDLDALPRADRTRLLLAAASTAAPDERAALEEQVIRDNMSVATQIAARYRNRGVPAEDLDQVAYLALVKAVRRYEYAPERDLLSFAVPTIRGEIKRHFRDHGWAVRPPRAVQSAQARIRDVENDLLQELGRSPRPSEIAGRLDLPLDLVVEALGANGCFQPTSLEASGSGDATAPKEWLGEIDPGLERAETLAVLKPLLEHLTERERTMVEMRFFHDATQAEIGEVLGITQMQVSRLLSNLMGRLRDRLVVQHHPQVPSRPDR
jgi:RNA polymerase sigma-B factor